MKIKREFIFIAAGILLLVCVIGFIFYSVSFLVDNTTQALNSNAANAQSNSKFNIEGLKKLGVIK